MDLIVLPSEDSTVFLRWNKMREKGSYKDGSGFRDLRLRRYDILYKGGDKQTKEENGRADCVMRHAMNFGRNLANPRRPSSLTDDPAGGVTREIADTALLTRPFPSIEVHRRLTNLFHRWRQDTSLCQRPSRSIKILDV